MSLISSRTLAIAALSAIVTALVFAAVLIFVRGDDNAPIQVVLPLLRQPKVIRAQIATALPVPVRQRT